MISLKCDGIWDFKVIRIKDNRLLGRLILPEAPGTPYFFHPGPVCLGEREILKIFKHMKMLNDDLKEKSRKANQAIREREQKSREKDNV